MLFTAVSASIAHKRAAKQAALGVDPRIAAVNGHNAANYLIGYFVFIAPIAFLSIFWGMASPLSLLVFEPLAVVGVLIGVRLSTWWNTRADVRSVYRIPTGALVAFGPLWMMLWFTLWLLTALFLSSGTTTSTY